MCKRRLEPGGYAGTWALRAQPAAEPPRRRESTRLVVIFTLPIGSPDDGWCARPTHRHAFPRLQRFRSVPETTRPRLLALVDLAATAVFAIGGAHAGVDAGFDVFGLMVVAFATALGGGMIRDVLIGAAGTCRAANAPARY